MHLIYSQYSDDDVRHHLFVWVQIHYQCYNLLLLSEFKLLWKHYVVYTMDKLYLVATFHHYLYSLAWFQECVDFHVQTLLLVSWINCLVAASHHRLYSLAWFQGCHIAIVDWYILIFMMKRADFICKNIKHKAIDDVCHR